MTGAPFAIGACAALLLAPAAAQGGPRCISEAGPLPPPATLAGGDRLGTAVTAFGDELIVGAPRSDAGGNVDQGAAYVYERDATGTWVEREVLFGSTSDAGDAFGSAVDMTGQYLVVGAPENLSWNEQGKAYVFEKGPGGAWTEAFAYSPLTPGELVAFGQTVAVDGNLAAVSGPFGDQAALNGGVVWLFERAAGSWSLKTTLVPTIPVPSESFGYALDIRGSRLAVGAVQGAGVGVGRVLIFEPVGGVWTERSELTPAVGVAGDFFGNAVSLGPDEIAVGSCFWGLDGAVFLFSTNPGIWPAWTEDQTLVTGVPAQANNLGVQVELEGDGLVATDIFGTGYANVYRRDPSGWTEVDRLVPSVAVPGNDYGTDAAFTGLYVHLGGPRSSVTAATAGDVTTFDVSGDPVVYCTAKTNSQGCVPQISTGGGSPGFSDPSFAVDAQSVISQRAGLLFFGINGPFNLPFFGGTLCVMGPLTRTPIQWSFGNVPVDCSGAFTFDLNAFVQGGGAPWVVPGSTVWSQYWYRDPDHADGTGVGLSDAASFGMCP